MRFGHGLLLLAILCALMKKEDSAWVAAFFGLILLFVPDDK